MAIAADSLTEGWRAAERDADITVMLPDAVPIFFRRIAAAPNGFLMGSRHGDADEEPLHLVVIPNEFDLGTFPVTQAQWRAVVNALGSTSLDPSPNSFKDDGDLRPVENVSWDDAVAWCEAATPLKLAALGRDGLRVDHVGFRLPNEAEWEHACRGGTETEYASGDGEAALREIGWFDGNTSSTQLVGRLAANRFGLGDMHGNVWEWCADVWDAKAYRKRADGWEARAWELADAGADGQFPRDKTRSRVAPPRVVRGGSWSYSAWHCRSSARLWDRPHVRNADQGFRVCLVRSPSPAAGAHAEAQAERLGATWAR